MEARCPFVNRAARWPPLVGCYPRPCLHALWAKTLQDANKPRTGLDVLNALLDLVDEFGAQFATDPPCQPTLARVAG
jgi:hypothetical protein